MAQAPKPGVGKRKKAAEDASRVVEITIRGQSCRFAPGNLPMQERLAVRKQTGLPFEAFWGGDDRIGLDSVLVLWWIARRQSGERQLTFDQAVREFPLDLTEDDIAVSEITDEEDDNPEV